MTYADLPILLLLPPLLVLSATFSASETVFFGISYHDRMRLKRASPAAGAIVNTLLSEPRPLLITVLLMNMAANVVYLVLLSVLLLRATNPAVGIAVNAAGVAMLILVGEVFAKLVAASNRVLFCRVMAGVIYAVHRSIAPVRIVLEHAVVTPLSRLIRPQHETVPALTTEELSRLIELGAHQGAIDTDEQRLLAQVVELGTLRVREVMTPRVELTWLEESGDPDLIRQTIEQTRLTRIPICRGTLDGEVLGFLNTKRYLASAATGHDAPMHAFLEPARYLPEQARLDRLLDHLRETGTKLALCVDEHGVVTGLVAIEDIARRLVPQTGTPEEREAAVEIEQVGRAKWRVPGRLSVRAWAELFDHPGETRVNTAAGLVLTALGRIPREGDAVTLGNVRIEVESVRGNVIESLLVSIDEFTGPPAPRRHAERTTGQGGEP